MYLFGPYGNYSLMLELLILTLISVRQCPKRKSFLLRAVLCLAVLTAYNLLINTPLATDDYSDLNRPYVYVILLGLGCWCCWDLRVWHVAYILTMAYALQYAMYTVWLILCRLFVPGFEFFTDSPVINVFYGLALAGAIAAAWFVSRRNKHLPRLEKVNIPVLVIFLLVILAAVYMTNEAILALEYEAVMMVRYACTVICLLGVAYAATALVYQRLSLNNALYGQIIQRQKEEYEQRRASVEDLNIKCHDLRYQIRSILQRRGEGSPAELRDIEEAIGSIQNAYHTGSDALDVIISEKARLCSAKGIAFTFMGDGALIAFMRDEDVYRLFSNAIDNAIEAVARVEEEKRIIGVTVQPGGPFVNIHVENYCSGQLRLVEGLPQTSKEDKTNHGFGVRSMRSVARSYGGTLQFRQEGDVFSLDIMLPAAGQKS